jgi:hypothetical protein
MRKNYLLFIIIAFPFLLMSCITPGLKEINPVGKVYRDSIQLWGKNIPLPEGEWKVIGRGAPSNAGRNMLLDQQALFFNIVLLKESETKTAHSFLLISTESMTNNGPGYKPVEYFNRKDVHHVVVKNNEEFGAQDGWLINHYLMSIDLKGRPALEEAYNYLLSNKIKLPKIMIQTFHHFTGKYQKNRYLDVECYSNPEIEGFEAPNETNWGTSEWHPLRIDNDPKKKAYIERLKNEGAIMHEKIRVGFGD